MKILAIQNRMGIGDTVIFLPYIEAISRKFNVPINLLVKKSSKADQYLKQTNYIDEIIFLEMDRQNKNGNHNGIIGGLRLAKKLNNYNFDKIFIFNSSLRFYLISKFAGIKEVYQYPLFKKSKQHLIQPALDLLKNHLDLNVENNPQIHIDNDQIKNATLKFNIKKEELNILLGIGGSGSNKRVPSKIFLSVMNKISNLRKCKFFLATGKNSEEQIILNDLLNSKFKNMCVPLDNMSIEETLPVIKNCNVSICNDTGFSHLSSALNVKTITLMVDTPLIYGSYSSNMYPIIPDGEVTVSHDTFGKDKINPDKIFDKLISIID